MKQKTSKKVHRKLYTLSLGGKRSHLSVDGDNLVDIFQMHCTSYLVKSLISRCILPQKFYIQGVFLNTSRDRKAHSLP